MIEFLVLTGCRASEVTKMRWAEVDFGANMVWTLPSARTRSYREHRVPLSKYALALLNDQKNRIEGEDKYVWSLDGKRPISSKAVYLYLTRTMGLPYTLHGFRNLFRDWAGNETPFDRVTCELAPESSVKSSIRCPACSGQ